MDQNIWEEHKWGLLLMCGQQNIMAYARDNAGQNKGHTPRPRIEIENPDPPAVQAIARLRIFLRFKYKN